MLFFPTADEDFKYFRNQGYDGSINDMHYKAMGDLGYTGSLNDRIHAYLTETYGSFYEAMRDLRNGTSVFALVGYRVLGINPDLVLDFKNSYYRTGGTKTTLNPAVTHTRAGQATMVDSDGLLKWAPHNLVTYSNDFTNSSWTKNQSTITATASVSPDGETSASEYLITGSSGYLQHVSTVVADTSHTSSCYIKKGLTGGSAQWLQIVFRDGSSGLQGWFDISNGVIGSTSTFGTGSVLQDTLIEDVGGGYFRCSATGSVPSTSGRMQVYQVTANGSNSRDQTNGIYIYGAHLYRSDLGGMVNNPATGDSYVPTTSSAVYLPRVNHHVYNGSAWVNEGILHESEARTNLITHSDFSGSWITLQSTLAEASVTAPDGSQDAYSLTPSTSSSVHYAQFNLTAANGTHTDSVYVKANGYTNFYLRPVHIGASEGPTSDAKFNLTTGEVISYSTDTFTSISIEDVSNGWYKISFGFKTTGTVTTSQVRLQALNNTGAGIFAGDGTSGFYLFAPQREAGPTVSSYIATSGSTATRAAETLLVPAANLPYSSTNMSIQIDGKMTYSDTGVSASSSNNVGEVTFLRWQEASNQFIGVVLNTLTSRVGQVSVRQRNATDGFDEVTSAVDSYTPDTNVPFNIASRHGSTFINGAVDGTALTANTTPTALPDLSSTNLELGHIFMGTIAQFRMWDEDLTDAGITEAST